jgi:hypothetical protein
MARRPTRKVTYFEPVAPRLARNTIIALPLEDVDFENRLLIVRQGKGKKDRGYTLKSAPAVSRSRSTSTPYPEPEFRARNVILKIHWRRFF